MTKLMSFTGIALKNLFSKPATTQYPEVPKEYPERTRGHVENDIEQCILCGMCMRKCPPGAIKVDRAEGTWSIERFDCIQCGYCAEMCPKKCLKMVPGYQEPEPEKSYEVHKKTNMPKPVVPKTVPKTAEGAIAVPKMQDSGAKAVGKESNSPADDVAVTSEKVLPHSDMEQCVFCTLCAKKCPAQALTVDRAYKVWKVDEELCLGCGVCQESCPKHCIQLD